MHSTERAQRTVLSLEMACYHAAHDFRGGAEALAAMMGVSGAVLRNRLNPNVANHVLSVRDAAMIAELTGDVRIVEAMCATQNRGHFLMPDAAISEALLFHCSADIAKEFSEIMASASKKLEDKVVTQDEALALEKDFMEFCASAKTFVEAVKKIGGAV
jgi:hypothetical protein